MSMIEKIEVNKENNCACTKKPCETGLNDDAEMS